MLTDEQKQQLCAKIEAKAAEFAADPARGRRAGYQPKQKYYRPVGEMSGQLEAPAPISLRDDYSAWLYGVAENDLQGREWQIIESAEGPFELLIL